MITYYTYLFVKTKVLQTGYEFYKVNRVFILHYLEFILVNLIF